MHSSNQDTLSSLDKIRSERDVAIQLHAQEIAALEDRLNEAERTLAASQADLNQAQHHALMLEDQKTELKRVADAKSLEVQEANKRWELVEKKMEDLAQGFSNATSTRDAPTLPNEDVTDPEIVDQLRTELGLLKEEVEILKERNSELEDLSLTVVERYGSGELASPYTRDVKHLPSCPQTEQEANLVKQVVKSTMHVNQKDLVQKANDLKRVRTSNHNNY
jgi:chromosome segregation ATPase